MSEEANNPSFKTDDTQKESDTSLETAKQSDSTATKHNQIETNDPEAAEAASQDEFGSRNPNWTEKDLPSRNP